MTLRKMGYNLRKRHDSVLQPFVDAFPSDILRIIYGFRIAMPRQKYSLRPRHRNLEL